MYYSWKLKSADNLMTMAEYMGDDLVKVWTRKSGVKDDDHGVRHKSGPAQEI